MSIDYTKTKLWEKTLGQKNRKYKSQIDQLRVSFESVHENASLLASTIKVKFVEYTDHTIDHADALWNMTDIILDGSDLELNPTEAYVLGCSFLLHDLGMSCAIYNNEEELRNTTQWRNIASSLKRKGVKENDILKRADLEALRLLHPENAIKLPTLLFNKNGKKEFIINESKFRDGFGGIIGKLAYSHGLSVRKIEQLFPEYSSGTIPSLPREWEVNPIKLACILRIADAIHICSDRTPPILMASTEFGEVSKLHWGFQSKMNTPLCNKGQLEFPSLEFKKENREEWWTCFDTLKMIDRELREVNALLRRRELSPLSVTSVKNIENPQYLAEIVKVDGWTPVEANMKVSNVSGLVKSLGGSALYGNNAIVPLRELVQNASDAIRARRLIEERDKNWGDIHIRINEAEDGITTIEVEDNGIGMSKDVLVGHLLDFGSSFWHSNSMLEEFPELESSGFESTGHFGIGFFSVFMWGDKVTVISRKCNEALTDTNVLEFDSGTESRPLLRPAEKNEQLKDGGTKIIIHLKEKFFKKHLQYSKIAFNPNVSQTELFLCELFPCMDCNIYLEENGNILKGPIISANEWIDMDAVEFLYRVHSRFRNTLHENDKLTKYIREVCKRVREVKDENGQVVGRGALDPNIGGMLTVGGIKTSDTDMFAGVLGSSCSVANRYSASPIVSERAFKVWLEEQKRLLSKSFNWEKDDPEFRIATLLHSFGISVDNFTIAYYGKRPVKYNDIKKIVKTSSIKEYVIFEIPLLAQVNQKNFILEKNVFMCNMMMPYISKERNGIYNETSLYSKKFPNFKNKKMLSELVEMAIAEAWQENVSAITTYNPDRSLKKKLATYNKEDIMGPFVSVLKKPSKKITGKSCSATTKSTVKRKSAAPKKSPAAKKKSVASKRK